MTKTAPLTINDPRICIEPDGATLRIRFKDPETNADLVIVHVKSELAGLLAENFQSVAP